MLLRVLMTLLLGILAGCASQLPEERTTAQSCDAAGLGHLVGRTPDDGTLSQARQQSGAERIRVVAPGTMVTLEFDARRLTLYTDEHGKIKLISCG